MALRRGKSLAISEDTCLETEKVRSKLTRRDIGVGLKRRRELDERRLGWRLAWPGSTLGLKRRQQYSDQRFK